MPTDRRPLLFVSSTSDLDAERAAVESAIGTRSIEVYRYEDDVARGQSPKARLQRVLSSTDIYLGIFGTNYGSPYPGEDFDGSIVEWEFDTAREQPGVEILAFDKSGGGADIEPRQQRFLDRMRQFDTGVWLKSFTDIEQFKTEVRDAVMVWLLQFWDRYASIGSSKLASGVASGAAPVAVIAGAALSGIVWGVTSSSLSIGDALTLIAVVLATGTAGIFISSR